MEVRARRIDGLLIAAVGAAVGATVTVMLGYLLTRPAQVELLFRDEATPRGSEVSEQLPAGSILYFSGSQFEYRNRSCANGSNLCADRYLHRRPIGPHLRRQPSEQLCRGMGRPLDVSGARRQRALLLGRSELLRSLRLRRCVPVRGQPVRAHLAPSETAEPVAGNPDRHARMMDAMSIAAAFWAGTIPPRRPASIPAPTPMSEDERGNWLTSLAAISGKIIRDVAG